MKQPHHRTGDENFCADLQLPTILYTKQDPRTNHGGCHGRGIDEKLMQNV